MQSKKLESLQTSTWRNIIRLPFTCTQIICCNPSGINLSRLWKELENNLRRHLIPAPFIFSKWSHSDSEAESGDMSCTNYSDTFKSEQLQQTDSVQRLHIRFWCFMFWSIHMFQCWHNTLLSPETKQPGANSSLMRFSRWLTLRQISRGVKSFSDWRATWTAFMMERAIHCIQFLHYQ